MLTKETIRYSLVVGLPLLLSGLPEIANAYGFWRAYNGRQQYESAGRYDLAGSAWNDLGINFDDPYRFDWSIDFPKDGSGSFEGPFAVESVRNTWASTASNVISDWTKWANIKIGEQKIPGAGHVQFVVGSADTAIRASTTDPVTFAAIDINKSKPAYWDRPYIDPATGNPDPAAQPITSQIRFSALHEFTHALGLDDLYLGYTEEFVDHPVKGAALPDRDKESRADNLMQGASDPWGNGPDYPHRPVIDNDEIAGVSWLWGGKYNQIVTGDLETTWNGGAGRNTEPHHGDQNNPTKGWWDYRISLKPGGTVKPYIDIEFPGYQTFAAQTYSGASVVYGGNQGGNSERFIVDQAGWGGNLDLYLKSSFEEERRVQAWLSGGGRADDFTLPINTRGLTFDGKDSWAMVFGPLGEGHKDFGDAPDSYKTLLASDGPRYDEGDAQRLGHSWDKEPDGQPTQFAIGDDLNSWWGVGTPDDEDGVIFGDNWVNVLIDVSRPGPNEYSLRAWWDLNKNGIFDHLTELFINEILDLTPGSYWRHFDLGFNPSAHYSRFRLTWLDDPFGLLGGVSRMTDITPHGEFLSADGRSHGEVEDYYVPEPGTLALFGAGAFAFKFAIRRKRKLMAG